MFSTSLSELARLSTSEVSGKGPFTKDVRARGEEGGLENQDKLGHRGGRGFFSNPDIRNFKKFKNKFLFPLFLTLLPIVKLAF